MLLKNNELNFSLCEAIYILIEFKELINFM